MCVCINILINKQIITFASLCFCFSTVKLITSTTTRTVTIIIEIIAIEFECLTAQNNISNDQHSPLHLSNTHSCTRLRTCNTTAYENTFRYIID